MIKTAIVFDHRGRVKDKNQTGPLEVRLTHNRKSYYINTGISVEMGLWFSGKIEQRPEWPSIEARLNIIRKKIEDEINDCIDSGREIVPAEIRRKAWDANANKNTQVIDWIKEQIPTLKVCEVTRKHYVTLCRRLEDYGKFKTWNDITVVSLYDFDSWLHQISCKQKDADVKAKKTAVKLCDGTVYNYHKHLKRMLNHAVLLGVIEKNPYNSLRGQFSRGDCETVKYLTEEELAAIEKSCPTPGSMMEIVRDLFVFQAYTGMSFSDIMKFDINDYVNIDGRWMAISKRVKTGVPYVSQLLQPAVEVLEKYNWQVPWIQNHKYNELLKYMGEMLGLQKRITSHMARHTFATMMLRHGAKIENVSRMLGHTNITQTQRYAKVLAESVHDDFEKMDEYLAKRKVITKNEKP